MARKAKGEGSISKMKDGTYCGRLTVGYDDNGKQKRKAFYGKTKREVLEKMKATKEEQRGIVDIQPEKVTVGEWLDFWLVEYKKREIRHTTYCGKKLAIEVHIKPVLGKIRIKDLRKEMIQQFINGMADQNLSRATIVKTTGNLRESLGQAAENGFIPKNPAMGMQYPRIEKEEMKVLSADEQARFVQVARNHQIGELFILMLATGLRFGEAIALKWTDIDFEQGRLTVNKTYASYFDNDEMNKNRYTVNPVKTKASNRSIPLLPKVLEMLKSRKQNVIDENDLVFRNDTKRVGYTYQFITKGKAIYWLNKLLTEADVNAEDVHLHTLRHTFATRGLENGIELKVMQELLGHTSIDLTADTYTHVLLNKKRDSIMKLAHIVKIESKGDEPKND